MKILQLTTSLSFAGAEQIILDLCGLSEHEFTIAGLQSGDGSFAEKAHDQGLDVVDLKMAGKMDLSVFSRLSKLIHNKKFDVIHSHLVHANFVGRIAASSSGTPIISTVHIVEKRFRPSHKWMERLTASKAHSITAVSQCVKDHLINNIKLPQEKVKLIANGIDTTRFNFEKNQARDIDFLFLGRLDTQKGLDTILPTLKSISQDNNVHMAFVGRGPEEASLKKLCQDLDLSVHWVGFCKEPADWMRRSKVCLVPSRWEGFGLVAAEAMACGCQVIHSGVDSLDSVCGVYGIKLDSDKTKWPDQLLNSLRSFSENHEGRQWIVNNYDKQNMIQSFNKLYKQCAASPA